MKKFGLPFVFVLMLLAAFVIFFTVRKSSATLQYPDPEQFSKILSEAELTQWTVEAAGSELDGAEDSFYSKARGYELYTLDKRLRCQFFNYLSHAGTPGLVISVLSEDGASIMEEEYEKFLHEELPELWTLASKLCSDSQAVLDLQRQLETDYERAIEPEQYADRLAYVGEWGAQRSGIYGTARLVRQDAFSFPMWYYIRLTEEAEYSDSRLLEEDTLEDTLSDTEALRRIDTGNMPEKEKWEALRKQYAAQGRLTEIMEAGEFQFRYPASSNLPKNMSFYQKAVLTDESGSLPVYIAPTALSREELGRERLHLIQIVQGKNDEICYVISRSCLINQGGAYE